MKKPDNSFKFPSFKYLKKQTKKIENISCRVFKKERFYIEEIFSVQTKLGEIYLPVILMAQEEVNNVSRRILFSAYIKNIFSIYAAYELVSKGLFGPARVLIRHSFEYLFLSKYCAISNDEELLKTWREGNHKISLQNNVFNKVIKPNKIIFEKQWREICKFAHATIYSMQITLHGEDVFSGTMNAYAMIEIILRCNYHLLNSYLINKEMNYLLGFYLPKGKKKSKILRIKMKELIKNDKKRLNYDARLFIRNFEMKWALLLSKRCEISQGNQK